MCVPRGIADVLTAGQQLHSPLPMYINSAKVVGLFRWEGLKGGEKFSTHFRDCLSPFTLINNTEREREQTRNTRLGIIVCVIINVKLPHLAVSIRYTFNIINISQQIDLNFVASFFPQMTPCFSLIKYKIHYTKHLIFIISHVVFAAPRI